jgi:hypothetical protein
VAYITQSLDKGTLGSSSIMGWQADVGAKGQDYALTSTFLWIGIIVGEPIVSAKRECWEPSLMIKTGQPVRPSPASRQGARHLDGDLDSGRWFSRGVGRWGSAHSLTGFQLLLGITFSLNVAPVFALRALLGFFESSFSPCLVASTSIPPSGALRSALQRRLADRAVTVQWFTTDEQTLITTVWQTMFACAGFVSNLLAYGFYQLHGSENIRTRGLYTWQWMTLCIAIISAIASGG